MFVTRRTLVTLHNNNDIMACVTSRQETYVMRGVTVTLSWSLHVEFAWRWIFFFFNMFVFTGKVTGSVTPRASHCPRVCVCVYKTIRGRCIHIACIYMYYTRYYNTSGIGTYIFIYLLPGIIIIII